MRRRPPRGEHAQRRPLRFQRHIRSQRLDAALGADVHLLIGAVGRLLQRRQRLATQFHQRFLRFFPRLEVVVVKLLDERRDARAVGFRDRPLAEEIEQAFITQLDFLRAQQFLIGFLCPGRIAQDDTGEDEDECENGQGAHQKSPPGRGEPDATRIKEGAQVGKGKREPRKINQLASGRGVIVVAGIAIVGRARRCRL